MILIKKPLTIKVTIFIILATFLFTSTASSSALRPNLMTETEKGPQRFKDTAVQFPLKDVKSPRVITETVHSITGWLKDDIEKITELELDKALPVLVSHLKELKALGLEIQDKEIGEIMKGIRADRGRPRKEWGIVKFFRGVLVDIIDEDDRVIAVTEIGFAHILGLGHRSISAFVITPQGKLLIQRRAPGRKYPFYLSNFGGHPEAGQDYEQGIKEELVQELHLLAETGLKGRLGFLDEEHYDEPEIANKELRRLYVYQLTQEEYAQVMEYAKELETEKAKRTEDEFESWLNDFDMKKKGFGEVWSYYEIDVDVIKGAKVETIFVVDDKRDMELHYLEVVDMFKDGPKKKKAYFTPDILERIVRKSELMTELAPESLRKKFEDLREVQDKV